MAKCFRIHQFVSGDIWRDQIVLLGIRGSELVESLLVLFWYQSVRSVRLLGSRMISARPQS